MNYRCLSFCLATLLAQPLGAQAGKLEFSQADAFPSGKLTPVQSEVLRSLRTLRDPEADGPEAVGLAIHTKGVGVVGCLLSILKERQILDPDDQEGGAQVLSEVQLEAILLALESLGRSSVFDTWETYFEVPLDQASTNAAIYSLGAFGTAEDLSRLMALPVVEGKEELMSQAKPSLRAATAAIIKRDSRSFSRLTAMWSRLDRSWQVEIVKAVGQAGDSRGVDLLTDIYRRAPDQQRLVASQLPLMGPSNTARENLELAQELRAGLQSDVKEDVQAAALGLAVLEDFSSLPFLIDLLDDSRPGVKSSAHHALTKLTNKALTANSELWKRWHQRELDWFANQHDAEVTRLRSTDRYVVIAALREIGRHRLNRHDLALEIAPALNSFSESVRLMAIGALNDLGSRWGAESLIQALGDSEEEVAGAAYVALRAVTGQDHGDDPADWLEVGVPRQL